MYNLTDVLKRIQERNTFIIKGEYLFSALKENDDYLAYIGYIFVDKKAVIPVCGSDYMEVYDKKKDTFANVLIDFKSLKDVEIPEGFTVKDGYTIL